RGGVGRHCGPPVDAYRMKLGSTGERGLRRLFDQLSDQAEIIFYFLIYDFMALALFLPSLGGAVWLSGALRTMGPLVVVSWIVALCSLLVLLFVPHWIAKEAAMRRVVHEERFLQSFGSALRGGGDAVMFL